MNNDNRATVLIKLIGTINKEKIGDKTRKEKRSPLFSHVSISISKA